MDEPYPALDLKGVKPSPVEIRDGLEKFEHRLAERTKLPSNKLGEFMQWPEARLKLELKNISQILKRFAEAVVDSMENVSNANSFLQELHLRSISRDHDWRSIFSTIRAQEEGYEGYKCAVLIKYLQYLSYRKGLIAYISATRRALEETDEYTDIPLVALRLGSEEALTHRHGRTTDPNFVRLPLGESVDSKMSRGHEISIMLAAHVYRLTGDRPLILTDQNGVSYMMKPGRNMVGRHPEGEVVVDQDFTDVSRAHMIIEWDGTERVRLIDFSSRGSYVHRSAVGRSS